MFNEFITIRSEEDAWKILERLLLEDDFHKYIEFESWPFINLNIKGERYSSTLPANLLNKLSHIQSNLNTFYGNFVYEGDARNLKKYEKHDIELVFKVKEGSTALKADATGLLNKLGESMTKPETQKVAGITMCVLALILSGAGVVNNYSDNQKVIELQRLKLLEKAIETVPELKNSSTEIQKTFRRVISSAADADSISIGDTLFDKYAINKIAEKTNNKIEWVEIEGEFHISSIRGYESYYTIEIIYEKNSKVRARLSKDIVSEEQVKLLTDSLINGSLVSLNFKAKKIEDGYASARVQSVG